MSVGIGGCTDENPCADCVAKKKREMEKDSDETIIFDDGQLHDTSEAKEDIYIKVADEDIVAGKEVYILGDDEKYHSKFISVTLKTGDPFKAFVADDGCRYGLFNTYIKKDSMDASFYDNSIVPKGEVSFSIGSDFASSVREITDALAEMLIEKNIKYGNSALEPKRIFSKASAVEQILVRADDKLSRIANQDGTDDEDPFDDLMGYLVLLKIAKGK